MKSIALKLAVIFLSVNMAVEAQDNFPVDFVYVKGGEYFPFINDEVEEKRELAWPIEDFYLSAFEVPVMDFEKFCKETNCAMPKQPDWSNLKMPVVNVTYQDALAYCGWMFEKYGVPFTLPTATHWEYAARNGQYSDDNFIYNRPLPNPYVVYAGNSKEKPECITCMQPNEVGLYAMCGNVWEWGLKEGTDNYMMGGSFFEDAAHVKVNTTMDINEGLRRNDLGFRVMLTKENWEWKNFLDDINGLVKKAYGDAPPVQFAYEGIYSTEYKSMGWVDFKEAVIDYDDKKFIIKTTSGREINFSYTVEQYDHVLAMEEQLKSFTKRLAN